MLERFSGSLSRALPRGAVPVGAGIVTLGAASFVYLSAAGRALDPKGFAAVSVLWVMVNVLGSGMFLPLEQEVTRAVAARRAANLGSRPVIARVLAMGAGLALVLLLVSGIAFQALSTALFSGEGGVFVAALAGGMVLAPAYVSRGALAGNGRFGSYGLQLGLDGAIRVGGAVVLLIVGVHRPAAFGWILVVSAAVSVVVSVGNPRTLAHPGPVATWHEVSQALGLLLLGSVLSQLVINAAPAIAQLLSNNPTYVGTVLSSLVVARMPLLLFAAVQASLLPRLSTQAADRDLLGFRETLQRILRLVGLFTLVSTPALVVLGPFVIGLLFGRAYVAPPADLFAYGLSTGLFMVMLVLAQGLISFQRYASAAAGWALALAGLLVVLTPPRSVAFRIDVGLVTAGLCGAATLAVRLRRVLRAVREQQAEDAADGA